MIKKPETGIFKPKSTPSDAKIDSTTKAVREIARDEAAARHAKTERLKAARLAREAEAPAGDAPGERK